MTGPDSYLRMKPEEEIIKKYKLSSYVRQADKLATNLEAKIKENFEFKTKGVVESKNYYSVLVYYKSFYYREYIEDFNAIVRILINKEKLNIDASTEVDYEKVAEIYKIQVKAMEILNKHLNEYMNKNEFHKTYIKFTNRKVSTSVNSLNSYLLSLSDFAHANSNVNTVSNERVQKYLKEKN